MANHGDRQNVGEIQGLSWTTRIYLCLRRGAHAPAHFRFYGSPAVGVAAKLRLPDLISAEELAGPTNADTPSLRRLLRFLASLGIFVEDGAGKFRHTPLSKSLRSAAPQSFGGLAISRQSSKRKKSADYADSESVKSAQSADSRPINELRLAPRHRW